MLAAADFHDVNLCNALLTGSQMQEANFISAEILAAQVWPISSGLALIYMMLTCDASFHLGSSRSGLVDSLIACEGSRTGFYTDDYDEQDIKPIEEIRKANLRGADLRGANIEGSRFLPG